MPAFVLMHLDLVSLAFTGLWQTILAHGIWVPILLFVVALAVWPTLVLPFVRSRGGLALVCAFLAVAAGWEARAALDTSIALRRALQAEIAATQAAADKAAADLAAAQAAAAAARAQAEAQRAVAQAANARAASSDATATTLQEQVDDYADTLSNRPARCVLSAADARRLRAITGAAAGRRAAAGAARATADLR